MENILKSISEAPEAIAKLEKANLEIKIRINQVKERLDKIKNQTLAEVSSEKEGGKKVYSNAEMRELETNNRLLNNAEYIELSNSLEKLEQEKSLNEIEIQRLNNQLSVDRYKVRLYTAEKMEQASTNFTAGLGIVNQLLNLFKPAKEDVCPF